MRRLKRALRAASLAAWCELRGHDYHTNYAYVASKGTVRMYQCLRCGRFGGYSRSDKAAGHIGRHRGYDPTATPGEAWYGVRP